MTLDIATLVTGAVLAFAGPTPAPLPVPAKRAQPNIPTPASQPPVSSQTDPATSIYLGRATMFKAPKDQVVLVAPGYYGVSAVSPQVLELSSSAFSVEIEARQVSFKVSEPFPSALLLLRSPRGRTTIMLFTKNGRAWRADSVVATKKGSARAAPKLSRRSVERALENKRRGDTMSITSPAANTRLTTGKSTTVKWDVGRSTAKRVDLVLLRRGHPVQALATRTPNDGSLPWTPAKGLIDGSYALLVTNPNGSQASSPLPVTVSAGPARRQVHYSKKAALEAAFRKQLAKKLHAHMLMNNPLIVSACRESDPSGACVLRTGATYKSLDVGHFVIRVHNGKGGRVSHAHLEGLVVELRTRGHVAGIDFDVALEVTFDSVDVWVRPRSRRNPPRASWGAMSMKASGADGHVINILVDLANGDLREALEDGIVAIADDARHGL